MGGEGGGGTTFSARGGDGAASREHWVRRSRLEAASMTRFLTSDPGAARHTRESKAANRIQNLWLQRAKARHRLDCGLLVERLRLEGNLMFGVVRLVLQLIAFFFLYAALISTSHNWFVRLVVTDLKADFNLDSYADVGSTAEFVEVVLPEISAQSKKYFLRSNEYFDAQNMGHVQLLAHFTEMSAPLVLKDVQVNVGLPRWSMSAWVKLAPSRRGGFLVRKRPMEFSHLSCWGWHIDSRLGPSLRYAGHDFLPRNGKQQVEIFGSDPPQLAADTYQMLSIVVNGSIVKFYRGQDLEDVQKLPQRLTDCLNTEGLLIGDGGLGIGALRFYPEALRERGIQEIYKSGDTLAHMASGRVASSVATPEASKEETSMLEQDQFVANVLDVLSSVMISEELKFYGDAVSVDGKFPPLMHGDLVVGSVGGMSQLANITNSSGPAGNSSVGLLSQVDWTGRAYTQLVLGPVRLSKPNSDAGEKPRSFLNVPSFYGKGVTITFWYRHYECVDVHDSCGVYLFYAMTELNVCWSLWLERDGIWFDNPLADGAKYQYPLNFVKDEYKWRGPKIWRHIAFSLDSISDTVSLFMDGSLAWKGAWGSRVAEGDCGGNPSRTIAFGHSSPGWTYGAEVDVYDLRWYVHDAGGLPDENIYALAQRAELSPGITSADLKCMPESSEELLDSSWKDVNQNGCEWYYTHKQIFPDICKLRQVQAKCGLSCRQVQACFPGMADNSLQRYFVWDRIRRIEPQTANGTVCLGNSYSKANVVQQCKDWVNTGISDRDWEDVKAWAGNYIELKGRKINVTDCEVLRDSINENCDFDMAPIEQFTTDLKRSNGDFTLSFWMKPLVRPDPDASLHTDGRFYPHLSLYSAISPPQHPMSIGLWSNPDGEMRQFSSCPPSTGRVFENVELMSRGVKTGLPSSEEWTFVAISRRNSSQPRTTTVSTNLGNFEEETQCTMCLYNETSFFTALELNYPALVSPIMLVPQTMGVQEVQRLYLSSYADMRQRTGPATDESRQGQPISVTKRDFSKRSVLLAPPIVTSRRSRRTAQCPHSPSTKFIQQAHALTVDVDCSSPYQCSEAVLKRPELTIACSGSPFTRGDTAFGIEFQSFQGDDVVVDFLYSLTDNPFLFRGNNTLLQRGAFIDSSTGLVNTILVFFSPDEGIITQLTIRAEINARSVDNQGKAAMVHFEMVHHVIVEGPAVLRCIAFMACVIVNLVIILSLFVRHVRKLIQDIRVVESAQSEVLSSEMRPFTEAQVSHHQIYGSKHLNGFHAVKTTPIVLSRDKLRPWKEVVHMWSKNEYPVELELNMRVARLTSDLVSAMFAASFVALNLFMVITSAEEAHGILDQLYQVEWDSDTDLQMTEKAYFNALDRLDALVSRSQFISSIGFWALCINVLSLVQCLGAHPRLALLTSTLKKSFDDLWHALIIISILMSAFAAIGSWKFGSERREFTTVLSSLRTEFSMLFGNFPENWDESSDMIVFTAAYLLILFLLVQNFLLAIIVEAYMEVRKENEDCEVEGEFLHDSWNSLYIAFVRRQKGWPDRRELANALDAWRGKRTVHFSDLMRTGLFASRPGLSAVRSCINFLEHYHSFDFLRAKPLGDYLPTMADLDDDNEKFEVLQRSIFRAAGKPIPTLKEEGELAELQHQKRLNKRGQTVADSRSEKCNEEMEEADRLNTRAHESELPERCSSEDGRMEALSYGVLGGLQTLEDSSRHLSVIDIMEGAHVNDRETSPAPSTPPETPLQEAEADWYGEDLSHMCRAEESNLSARRQSDWGGAISRHDRSESRPGRNLHEGLRDSRARTYSGEEIHATTGGYGWRGDVSGHVSRENGGGVEHPDCFAERRARRESLSEMENPRFLRSDECSSSSTD